LGPRIGAKTRTETHDIENVSFIVEFLPVTTLKKTVTLAKKTRSREDDATREKCRRSYVKKKITAVRGLVES
jgi:hypothetical protein